MPGAWAAEYAVRSFLFGVRPLDTTTIIATGCVLILVSGFAAGLPAVGAPQIDPNEDAKSRIRNQHRINGSRRFVGSNNSRVYTVGEATLAILLRELKHPSKKKDDLDHAGDLVQNMTSSMVPGGGFEPPRPVKVCGFLTPF